MVESPYSPQSRVERLIAAGRLVLATLTFLVNSLSPSAPARYPKTASVCLGAYMVYALLVALLVWRSDGPLGRQRAVTHAFDLAVFPPLIYLAEGPTSPFFVYVVFLLLVATLRWQWRGTLWTAVTVLATFIGMGVIAATILQDPAFELNHFILQGVYLGVTTILVGYLGAHERRVRSELSMLAAWPRGLHREARTLVCAVLEYVAGTLAAPRVLMAWQVKDEPWLQMAVWPPGEYHLNREPLARFQPLVVEPLAGADFLCQDARASSPTVIYSSPVGLQRWRGVPLHPSLRTWYGLNAVLSLGLRGETLQGWLFCLDKPGMTSDDLALGQQVARLVTARMDHLYLFQELQRAGVAEERIRLARDLHDGLLQSLTGAALQLESARRLLEEDPEAARQLLQEIQGGIAADQRDLRVLIDDLRPAPTGPSEANVHLVARLEKLGERIEHQWGLRVELRMQRMEAELSEALAQDIYRIVREALVNAARHAEASTVRVDLGALGDQVRITVTDNGRGFPFRGYYDPAALTEKKLGPVTLRERIGSLGGSLAINSTESGARLEIALPLVRLGA